MQVLEEIAKQEKFQRKLALKGFVGHEVFLEVTNELKSQIEGAEAEIVDTQRQPINSDKLSILNHKLGLKSGLERALVLFTSLKEELEDM